MKMTRHGQKQPYLCHNDLWKHRGEGVSDGSDVLRTRKFGEKIYIDAEISADGDMILKEAHDIADGLHDRIEEQFPDIKHVMIHVNPAGYRYHYKPGTDL